MKGRHSQNGPFYICIGFGFLILSADSYLLTREWRQFIPTFWAGINPYLFNKLPLRALKRETCEMQGFLPPECNGMAI